MEFEGYNGDNHEAILKRATLVDSLSDLIEIPDGSLRKKMGKSADALDAVLCAFAAITVSTDRSSRFPVPSDEGHIAIHERIGGQAY